MLGQEPQASRNPDLLCGRPCPPGYRPCPLSRAGRSQALPPSDASPPRQASKSQNKSPRGAVSTAFFFHFFVMELEPAKHNIKCQAGDFLLQKLANPTVNLSTTLPPFHG